MASICFDVSTGWWSVRYYAGPDEPWKKKSLCKHPGAWSRSRAPKKPPPIVADLAAPFIEHERLARIGVVIASRTTDIAGFVRDYVASYKLGHKPRSVANLENATKKFVRWCEARKVTTVQAVSTQLCEEWIIARLTEGAERSTVVSEKGFLGPIWTRARKYRLIQENPWRDASVPGKPKDPTLKYWTVDELRRIFAVCEDWFRDYMLLDANTGIRVSALLGLTWKDVDFASGRLNVPSHLSKNGKAYSVPLNVTAHEVLASRNARADDTGPDTPIFPGKITRKVMSRSRVWDRLKTAVKRSKVRDFGSYAHAVRHSFAAALAGEGVPLRIIQELLGHSSIRTTEIYAKVAPARTQEVMGNFEIGLTEPDKDKPDPKPGPSG